MPISREPEPEYMDLAEEAQAYADADFADVNEAFVARLFEVTGSREQVLAVDLGTGPADIPARVLNRLASLGLPPWRIVAADASFAMLSIGRKRFVSSPSWSLALVQCDGKRLPLPSNTFDVVFSNSILHHITDAAPFWAEVRRIARPSGTRSRAGRAGGQSWSG